MIKFVTNASSATSWPKLEPMLIALHVGQIWNQFWWHHLVVKFWTNTSGTTQLAKFGTNASGILFSWRDNSSYRLWVRCASGNVLSTWCGVVIVLLHVFTLSCPQWCWIVIVWYRCPWCSRRLHPFMPLQGCGWRPAPLWTAHNAASGHQQMPQIRYKRLKSTL